MASNVRSIAREAGVSVATVSRVLNNVPTVAPELRERVQAVIERQSYLPNSNARSLSTSKQGVIGVIVQDLWGAFFLEMIKGLDAAAQRHGFHILLASTQDKPYEVEHVVRKQFGKVDGFIVAMPATPPKLLLSVSQRVPTVWVNQTYSSQPATSIVSDNYGAACAMTEHLLAQGRSKIAFIAGPEENYEARERKRGFLDTMARAGHSPAAIFEGDFFEECGFALAQRIAQDIEHIDAVFAANDNMALGCLLGLSNQGIRVPEQVIIGGFDDMRVARFVQPQLTSIRVDLGRLGEQAVDLLVKKINSTEPVDNVVMPLELVVRQSTRLIK
jgi:LacI family transcriptional regulator